MITITPNAADAKPGAGRLIVGWSGTLPAELVTLLVRERMDETNQKGKR